MKRIVLQLPKFADIYNGHLLRMAMRQLEEAFGIMPVESFRRGAYTTAADITLVAEIA